MRHPIARRSGFTLIELLVVIGIIGLLSAITFGLFRAANSSRNKSKSRGDIQAIAMACQSYRKIYGDFPCRSATGTDDSYRRDLLDQLIGRRLIRTTTPGGLPTLLNYDDTSLPTGSAGRQKRSFLNLGEVNTNDNSKLGADDWKGGNPACREFVDAWGNPYDYRYRVLTAGKYLDWKSPNFLFVCASANYVDAPSEGEILALGEYWDPAATRTGTRCTHVGPPDDGLELFNKVLRELIAQDQHQVNQDGWDCNLAIMPIVADEIIFYPEIKTLYNRFHQLP
jgi:prepilin-type N-terminal cleavage/methylation domain-containing protein